MEVFLAPKEWTILRVKLFSETFTCYFCAGKCVGLKLAGWNPDQVVQDSSPDQHHCVVFLAKTLYTHSAHQPRCVNG